MVNTRLITPRERIEKEIRDHKFWCNPKCKNLDPSNYRKQRLDGLDKQTVQKMHTTKEKENVRAKTKSSNA